MDENMRRAVEGLRHKRRLERCSGDEFNHEMESVTEVIQARNLPLAGRELHGISELCMKYGFSLEITEPLATRIFDWTKARYGARLNADLSVGYCPVLIRGEVYELRIPMLIYGGLIVCVAPPTPKSPKHPIVNVLELVRDLPQSVAESLSTSELRALQTRFIEATKCLEVIGIVQNEPHFAPAFGDLHAASDQITKNRPDVGLSRWASLQVAEKFMKGWLATKQVKYKWTHELLPLAELCEANGLPAVNRVDLAACQCPASVRYDARGLTAAEAVEAYFATLRIAQQIVHHR